MGGRYLEERELHELKASSCSTPQRRKDSPSHAGTLLCHVPSMLGQDHATQATDGAPGLLGEVGVGQGRPPGNEDRNAGDCGTIAGHIGEVLGRVWGARPGSLLARWLVLDQVIQFHSQAWFSHGTGSRRWQAEAQPWGL